MPDPVDHIARGHTDSTPCVPCQSARSEGSRPLHPAELFRGLPMTKQGGRWAAVGSALQFAASFKRGDLGTEPANYVTTGVHTTFELMVCSFGRSPTSSFVLCSLFSDELNLPQEACLDFPRTRKWEAATAHYRTLFIAYGIRSQDVLLRLPCRRLYIGPRVQATLTGLDTEGEGRLTRWTLDVQSD